MKIGIVEWVDSCTNTGWQSVDRLDNCGPSKCVSVGMIKEYPNHVSVIQSVSAEENMTEIISIPRVAITKLRYLKVK